MTEHEQRLNASISKSMAMMCVRNTMLDNIHAGIEPVSHTGDFSDVVVIDANGRRIPWPNVSRIGNEEMGRLMRLVVNRLYTFQAKADDLQFVAMMDRALAKDWRWDEPQLDEIILSAIATSRRGAEEMPRRRTLAHRLPARQACHAIRLNGMNPSALPVAGKGHTGRVLLRRGRIVRPPPWSSFTPPFSRARGGESRAAREDRGAEGRARFFSLGVGELSRGERLAMVERGGRSRLRRQSELLGLVRSSLYYTPRGASAEDLALMRRHRVRCSRGHHFTIPVHLVPALGLSRQLGPPQ